MTTVASSSQITASAAPPGVGRPPFFVLSGALLLYVLRFGYDYGSSDQDEIIPFLLHRMDPSHFTQDWFVQTQASGFSIRLYFVGLLEVFTSVMPIWIAVLLLYVTAFLLVAGAVYALTQLITGDRLAAAATVVTALVLTPLWTLGGNELVHRMLVASMLGWGIALWAVYHFLRARYVLSPVLLGIASWFQMLVGLQVAGLLILIRLGQIFRQENRPVPWGSWAMFTMLFVLWSSPAVGPLVFGQLSGALPEAAAGPSLFYILAEFRLPHHYLLHSFYPYSLLRFGALAVAGTGVLLVPSLRRRMPFAPFVGRVLVLIGVLCAVAYLFTEVEPVLLVAKLQLFKTTVLAKLLLLIVLAGAFFGALPPAARRPLEALLDRRSLLLAVVIAAWGLAGWSAMTSPDGLLHARIEPWARQASPLGRMEAWVGRNTRGDAIFAVPPSLSSFRTATERTIVINYKAIPYDDASLVAWFDRLITMAPIDLPDRAGPDIQERLDAAYERLTAEELLTRSDLYRFTHVVRRTPLLHPTFREVYRADGWYVYELVVDDLASSDVGNRTSDHTARALYRTAPPVEG